MLRLKDKEQLIEDLLELRMQCNTQTEEIKLLKTEISRLKKTSTKTSGLAA